MRLQRLLPSGSANLRTLFEPIAFHLAIESTLLGYSPGHIFADDAHAPRVALLWTQGRVFLAGEAKSTAVRTAVSACLENQLRADALECGLEAVILFNTPEWDPYARELLADFYPLTRTRHVYTRTVDHLPTAPVAGYTLQAVTSELLERTDLAGLADLIAEMQSERPSVADFLARSFGTAAVREQEIIGWCLSEYNTSERCELGIATAVPYRRQGVALATATATIRDAAKKGIREIGWHCWADNAPSVATARALGFELQAICPVTIAYVSELLGLAVHGFLALEEGEIERADDLLAKAEVLGELPVWALVQQARAQAALGHTFTALELLAQAVRRGSVDFERLEQDPLLAEARATAGWAELRESVT